MILKFGRHEWAQVDAIMRRHGGFTLSSSINTPEKYPSMDLII